MKLAVIALSSLLLTGCIAPQNARSVASTVKVAAYVGSYEALRQHPEWTPGFRAAHDELVRLESLERIDFVTVLSIIHRLPIKELKSDRAVLYITAATLLLEGYTGSVDLSKEEARMVVRALREGMALALPPPGPVVSVQPIPTP